MDIHAEHFPDKSVIIIDKNKLIGIENELFQNIVQESIDKGSKDITVDLSNVEYIASWGVGLLVHAYTSCNNRNIKFNIKGVSGNVMSVLHQLKLNEIFNVT